MKKIFFPGCRIKAGYPLSSQKLKDYLKEKTDIEVMGCCKEDFNKIKEDVGVFLICNNCSVELENLANIEHLTFVYELINQDESFPFPDYHGKKMYIQYCFYGYRNHPIDKVVRSLLKKMNIEVIEGLQVVDSHLNRKEHREVVNQNALLLKGEVVTSCAICNLAYQKANQTTHFLLDLLFEV